MARSPERKRLILLLALLVAVSVVAVVMRFREGGGDHGSAVQKAEKIEFSPHDLPQLRHLPATVEDGAEEVSFVRNPFAFGAPPTPTRNLTPPPTLPPPPPRTPRPTPTQRFVTDDRGNRLPPPPPFDKEYIGHLGPKRFHVAVFRSEEQLEVAGIGSVMNDVFILREIGLESVVIGFVGYPEKETTRVPLAEK